MKQCKAKSKQSGERCKRYASKGKEVCRCHGGRSSGPRTQEGKERTRLAVIQANLKHGMFTKEEKAERKFARALIDECRDTMRSMRPPS